MTTTTQNTATNLVEVVFQKDLTKQGLADLRKKYPKSLKLDMKDDGDFKEARKIRTERNKLAKAINDRRIEFTSELKDHGDNLINKIDVIYNPIITAFEAEDKHRKEEAAKAKAKHEKMLNEQRQEIADFKCFIQECKGKDAQYIADTLESVDLIETDVFHKDVIHEAIATKQEVIDTLNEMYQTAKTNELVEAERAELREKEAKLEKERTINERINNLRNIPIEHLTASPEAIQTRLTALEKFTPTKEQFDNRLDEVTALLAQVIGQLKTLHQQALLVAAAAPQPDVQADVQPEQSYDANAPIDDNLALDDGLPLDDGQPFDSHAPLFGEQFKSTTFEASTTSELGYTPLDLWPSDEDRANNDELDRVCDHLEEAENYIEFLEAKLNKALAA